MLFDSQHNQLNEPENGFQSVEVPMALCNPLLLSAFSPPYADSLTITSGGRKAFAERTADGLLRITNAPKSLIPASTSGGAGTELKKLLAPFFKTTATCGCNKMASEMDRLGPDWCIENIDMIVRVMASEAKNRNLPFIPLAAKAMIRISVRREKRLANLPEKE